MATQNRSNAEGGCFCDDFLDGANGGGSGTSGWGMSRASKRAKDHEKGGGGGEIMAKVGWVVG